MSLPDKRAYWGGSRVTAPLILNPVLDRGEWSASCPQETQPLVLTEQKVCYSPERIHTLPSRKEDFLTLTEIKPLTLCHPTTSLFTVQNGLLSAAPERYSSTVSM